MQFLDFLLLMPLLQKLLNCSNCSSDNKYSNIKTKQSNIFGLDLQKIKPKDPYFVLKSIILRCNKKNEQIIR